jgi:probable rRNA maturation factor
MEIGVTIRDAAWRTALPDARQVTRQAALAALALSAPPDADELAVVLADDAMLRALNRDYRGIDEATNVLAFAYGESEPPSATAPGAGAANEVLGDVVIALETAAAEAKKSGRGLDQHLSHLVIHGVLHLLGYDHGNDGDAETMEEIEIRALADIGIANPYAPPSAVKNDER